jgi:sulfatase maturation enzyme AslB (radical SAM superfamily)
VSVVNIDKEELAIREQAVHQTRWWVRLTRLCNNRCLFCLDAPAQNGKIEPDKVVQERLYEGRAKGASRLILSGGEPTIHPRFLDFVRMGRDLGYSWIQVITNGRMFRYRKFAETAVRNGLCEATVSAHGHTSELHDLLVGHKGAFAEVVTGIVNLLSVGVVVSVDVVLNRLNLPHLKEILDFYYRLGVREFDLLHMVPFGRGFDENRGILYPDDELLTQGVSKALKWASDRDVFVWTNRLPIRFLENHEKYFQDPHKIYDEVLGEREVFRELFATQKEPSCLGERCQYCFLETFCQCARRYAKGEYSDRDETEERTILTKEVVKGVLDGRIDVGSAKFGMPQPETLSEALASLAPFEELMAVKEKVVRAGRKVLGLPVCLGGEEAGIHDFPYPTGVVESGQIVLERFVSFFIKKLYRVYSVRCAKCSARKRCSGIQVNVARVYGLGVLRPF